MSTKKRRLTGVQLVDELGIRGYIHLFWYTDQDTEGHYDVHIFKHVDNKEYLYELTDIEIGEYGYSSADEATDWMMMVRYEDIPDIHSLPEKGAEHILAQYYKAFSELQ